MMFRSFD